MRNIYRLLIILVVFGGLAALGSVTAYANTYAVITGSHVNIRSEAEISPANRLFMATRGDIIQVTGAVGEFFLANVNGYQNVFVSREWVRVRETVGTVVSDVTALYSLPSAHGGVPVTMAHSGDALRVTGYYDQWFALAAAGGIAFVEKANVEIPDFVCSLPRARLGNTPGELVVEMALNYVGAPYLWGGMSPRGFDCSGFMIYLLSYFGVELNRVSRDMARNGTFVAQYAKQMGDLVFFANQGSQVDHVGMYIGDGRFIHASTYGTGVMINYVCNPWMNFVTARRVL